MIALIVLIAVIVVVGGGIELLRRARFGVGPSAAHHRALDTLGHITTHAVDSHSELVEPKESELLTHVRRAVESDRAQPRIDPQPLSHPVAVPAITGGPNFVGTVPAGHALGRGPDTEIEGVRLLLPDPPEPDDDEPDAEALEPAEPDAPDDPPAMDEWDESSWDDDATEEPAGDDAAQQDAADADPADEADAEQDATGHDEADAEQDATGHDEADAEQDATGHDEADDVDEVAVEPPAAWTDQPVLGEDQQPAWPGSDDPAWGELQGWQPADDADQAVHEDPTDEPVDAGHDQTAPVPPVDPAPTRVVRIDDLGGSWDDPGPEEWPATEQVAWGGTDWHATDAIPVTDAVPVTDAAPEVEPEPVEAEPIEAEPVEAEPVTDEHPIIDDGDEGTGPVVVRFDDLGAGTAAEHVSGEAPDVVPIGPGRSSGAIPGLTPDETRAQLAALAQSGGMDRAPGASRSHRRRRQRSQRSEHHHPISSALMLLAAVLVLGGAVYFVANGTGSGGHRARPAAVRAPAVAPAPTTPSTVPAASLVSQSASTATYEVTGSPTISLSFNAACWTEARQGSSTGPILFQGPQAAGALRHLSGPVWVRLGNPTAVSIQVAGTALDEPQLTAGTPFNLQFQ